jgi:hypothetical protein
MSSSYSPDLRIELIGTGDQAGVWGNTTNNNLGTFIENAVAGYTSVSIIASPQALTANDGAVDEARFAAIALTTTTGANFTVCIPPNSKLYTFYNASSYIATITNSTVKNGTTASGGTTIAIPAGKTMSVWSDGTNVAQQNNAFIAPTLGTPASGTMTNVTGLPLTTAVTGTLPVANGGTGVTTSTGTGNVVLSASPALTGTPTAPTASAGTSTTQLATTAFMATMYPVGCIYTSTVSTNPGTLFGFGTWVAFGAGRVLVGNGGGFTAGDTGGSADAIVVSHTHTATVTDPGHTHGVPAGDGTSSNAIVRNWNTPSNNPSSTSSATTGISVSNSTTGSSGTNANLQPYVVVYMWNRTA